jgi:hypothetical protein
VMRQPPAPESRLGMNQVNEQGGILWRYSNPGNV